MARTNWFDAADLKAKFPRYGKVQAEDDGYIETKIIPDTMHYVENYALQQWLDPTTVPEDIEGVAFNYAANKILADDENMRIAQARGMASFTIAGNQVNLDTSLGRNPLLSLEDEQILQTWREKSTLEPHVDKVTVKSQGVRYREAEGPNTRGDDEYIRRDVILPIYFYTPNANF